MMILALKTNYKRLKARRASPAALALTARGIESLLDSMHYYPEFPSSRELQELVTRIRSAPSDEEAERELVELLRQPKLVNAINSAIRSVRIKPNNPIRAAADELALEIAYQAITGKDVEGRECSEKWDPEKGRQLTSWIRYLVERRVRTLLAEEIKETKNSCRLDSLDKRYSDVERKSGAYGARELTIEAAISDALDSDPSTAQNPAVRCEHDDSVHVGKELISKLGACRNGKHKSLACRIERDTDDRDFTSAAKILRRMKPALFGLL